jgi:hypothetical protein
MATKANPTSSILMRCTFGASLLQVFVIPELQLVRQPEIMLFILSQQAIWQAAVKLVLTARFAFRSVC